MPPEQLVSYGPHGNATPTTHVGKGQRWRLGIARDAAFSFYYPDNLEMRRAAGVELVEFSPLTDAQLPPDLHALYLGGGYPECHARELAANTTMLASVRAFTDSGKPVLAECGGLLYLGEELIDLDGKSHRLCGVIPLAARMLAKLRCLGYRETTMLVDTPLGPRGTILRGHEFHYSEIVRDAAAAQGWLPAFSTRGAKGVALPAGGYARGNIVAGYVHWHFGSQPAAAVAFCCPSPGTLTAEEGM